MAMVALIPSDDDLDRLTLDGGESRDDLHLTVYYLGDDIDEDSAGRIRSAFENDELGVAVNADAFGAAVWNPNGDDPCTVLNVGGEELQPFRANADHLLQHNAEFAYPEQYRPWAPHICLAYDPERVTDAVARTGPVTFDRVRLDLDDYGLVDIPLGEETTIMPWSKVRGHSECPSSRPWAVVKDSDNSVAGCHASEADADAQLAALNANEGEASVATFQEECPPGQHRMPDGKCMPDDEMETETEAVTDDGRWNGVIAVEGIRTGDGRKFAEESLEWRDLPLSLYWQRKTADGHDDSVIVGSIDQIWRDGVKIRARGRFNLDAPPDGQSFKDAWDAYQLVRDKFMRGVSVTLDDVRDSDVEFVWPEAQEGESENGDAPLLLAPEEIIFQHGRIIDATLTGQPALQEAFIQIETAETAVTPPEEPEFGVVWAHTTGTSDGPWDRVVTHARLTARMDPKIARSVYAHVGRDTGQGVARGDCTFLHHEVSEDGVPGPANLTACAAGIAILNGGRGGVTLSDEERHKVWDHLAAHLADAGREAPPLVDLEEAKRMAALTAALAVPTSPPTEWFKNPGFDEITPLQVGDDGWVRGHLAKWGTCHTSFSGTCVTPPHEDEFSYFTTGEIVTREGTHVPVGQLTLGTGHAPSNLSARPASVHYDNTGYAVADVVAGADSHGIWVAGALCPDVDEITVRRLRASALSGDWRRIGGSLRLVAALVVNVPGFPIPRTRSHMHNGDQSALVAAGVVIGDEPVRTKVTDPTIAKLKDRIAATIGRGNRNRIEELTQRVHKVGT